MHGDTLFLNVSSLRTKIQFHRVYIQKFILAVQKGYADSNLDFQHWNHVKKILSKEILTPLSSTLSIVFNSTHKLNHLLKYAWSFRNRGFTWELSLKHFCSVHDNFVTFYLCHNKYFVTFGLSAQFLYF